MDLYLVPNNLRQTILVSANGVAHYEIHTSRAYGGPRITYITRPAISPEETIVAEIEWKSHGVPTIIRSPLLSGVGECVGMQGIGIRAMRYLYKRSRFSTKSSSRYFVGDDASEYRWKMVKGKGCILTRSDSHMEIASSVSVVGEEGLFEGEKHQVLRIQPCSVDIDLIILTFIIMEVSRRERDGYADNHEVDHDEDPLGDGGGDNGGDVAEVADIGGDAGLMIGEL